MKYLLPLATLLLSCSCTKTPENKPGLTQVLYESLAQNNKQKADDNRRLLTKLQHSIRAFEDERSSVTRQVIADCDTVLAQTEAVLTSLRDARLQLRQYAKQGEHQNAAELMLGKHKQGIAYGLLKRIDRFSNAICKIGPAWKPLILLPANGEQRNERAAQFYFANASIPYAFAALSHIEAKTLEYEQEAVWQLYMKFGDEDNIIKSRIGLFSSAQSNIVAAGDTYRAEMKLVAEFPEAMQTMTVNGRPIEIIDGQGQVVFAADGKGLEKQDSIKKWWIGAAKTNWRGADTLLMVRVPYTVVHKK